MQAGRHDWWRVATFSSGFAFVTVVAFADGGYFPETWTWTTLAFSTLALTALLLQDEVVLGRGDVAALVALTAFVGWIGLSAAWSPTPDDSLQEVQRGFMYVAALLAFQVLVVRDRVRDQLAGIATAATLVAAYSLGERLVRSGSVTSDPTQGTLLIGPIGYANALGILAALGLLLSLGLTMHTRSRGGRALLLALLLVLLPTLALTQSRGAAVALVAGLCVLVGAERARIAALLPGSPRLLPVVGAAVVAAVVSLVTVAALRADRPLGYRVDHWRVAWSQWEENAWLGSGAGTYARYWERAGTAIGAQDAHSLYLETLAELGPVGLALLLGALASPVLTARRARDHPLTGVAASAYAAYIVHAGVDWDWEMPVVTIAGLSCGVALLALGRDETEGSTVGPRGRGALAVAVLLLAGLAVAGRLAD